MPKNHNTHSSHEAQPDKLELSNNMSREELLEYYDGQLEHMARLGEALGRPEDEWTAKDGYYGGGSALSAYVDEIRDNLDHEVVKDDLRIARYMDASLNAVESYGAIDKTKLTNFYSNHVTDFEGAALRYIDLTHRSLERHNDKIDARIESGKKADSDEDLSRRDKKALRGTQRINSEILTDIGEAKRLLEGDTPHITATEFIELRRRHAADEVTDDDVKAARNDLIRNTYTLNHAADAYLLISGDDEHDFKNEDFISALDLDDDEMRAAKIASQQDARKEAAAENMETSAPLPTPQNKAQRKAAQASREQADNQDEDTTSDDESSSFGPGMSASRARRYAIWAADNGGSTTPPLTPNSVPAPTPAQLEGQKNLVKNARARLAESGRRRSTLWGGNYEKDAADAYLHQEFGDQVYKLMELTNRELIDNPDGMNNEQWGSLIAAHATASYDNVLNDSTEGLFDPEVKEKKSKRVAKVAARLGVLGVAGFIGGPAGVALAGGVMAGLKVGKGYEKNGRKHLKSAIKEHRAEAAVLEYVNNLADDEAFDPREAFEAARKSLSGQFEKEYVEKRRKRIMGAIAVGAAAGFASQVLIGQVFAAIPWVGDNIYQEVSKLSWSGTGVPWDGGLNPNFNYTMHARPFSLDALSSTFDFTR